MTRYTDEQAHAIKDRHSLALLKIPGVHGVGLQQDHAGNHTLVVMADATAERSNLPSQIEGLPVSVEESGPFKPLGASRAR
jgi:hypothetical protein